jgi:D-glycero-D-manno-heptose 1,7-bisphosphate phosphatase
MNLVILDRDGVINHESPNFIKSPDEWIPISGSIEAIVLLKRSGWKVAVASNQSGLGRGLLTKQDLDEIHGKMNCLLNSYGVEIDLIEICPHHPSDECECRKPKPGLYKKIASKLKCPLVDVPIVGDSPRDLQAALAVGATPFLVLTGNGCSTRDIRLPVEVLVFEDLMHVAKFLVKQN